MLQDFALKFVLKYINRVQILFVFTAALFTLPTSNLQHLILR